MNIENEFKSVLSFSNLYVESFSFKRAKDMKNPSLKLEIDRKITSSSPTAFDARLSCNLLDQSETFKLEIVIVGSFTLEADEYDEGLKTKIRERNSIAILFPFLRSQITTLTTQPGMEPVVLPVFNINAMLEKNESAQK